MVVVVVVKGYERRGEMGMSLSFDVGRKQRSRRV